MKERRTKRSPGKKNKKASKIKKKTKKSTKKKIQNKNKNKAPVTPSKSSKLQHPIEEAKQEAHSAFWVYYHALRCALICCCLDCPPQKDLTEEFKKLRNALIKSPFRDDLRKFFFFEAASRIIKLHGKLTESFHEHCKKLFFEDMEDTRLREALADDSLIHVFPDICLELVRETACDYLPPPRRIDWVLTYGNFPLLYPEDVINEFQDAGEDMWKELAFQTEARTPKIISKIDSYINQNTRESPGLETFMLIDATCPFRNEFRPHTVKGKDTSWTWRFERAGKSLAVQFECLATEYLTTADECAHLHFTHRGTPRQIIIETSTQELFAEIEGLVLSRKELFFPEGKPVQYKELMLPAPGDFETLQQWHEACTRDDGPISRAAELQAVTETQERILELEGEKDSPAPPGQKEQAVGASESENVFRKKGEYWTLQYDGYSINLRDAKGLRYIAYLLSHPEKQFYTALLIAEAGGLAVPPPGPQGEDITEDGLIQEGLTITAQGAAESVVSPKALTQYKRRLEELKEEKESAKDLNDVELIERIETEYDFIVEEIKSAVGLGARPRKVNPEAERTRKSVGENIRNVLKRIRELHPPLEQHLSNSLYLGLFCMYVPEKPTTWHT